MSAPAARQTTALMHPTAAHSETAAIACSPRCVQGRRWIEAIPATNPMNAIAAVATRRRLNCCGTTDLASLGSASTAARPEAAEVRGRAMTVGRAPEGRMQGTSSALGSADGVARRKSPEHGARTEAGTAGPLHQPLRMCAASRTA